MEEEGVVQPPPTMVVRQELPDPDALFTDAQHCRRSVATGVDGVISRCEAARLKLLEIVAVLMEEPGDAAEIIHANLLEVVPPGLDSLLLLDPAGKLVDSLFNWPGPLAGAVNVATRLVHHFFFHPDPRTAPLQSTRRYLGHLVDVVHADAGLLFDLYAAALGVEALPGGQVALDFWVANHIEADVLARVALQRLNVAVDMGLGVFPAARLCRRPCTLRVRPQAGVRVSTVALTLRQIVSVVVEVLLVLRAMRDTLVQLEQAVLNITGHDQDP